MYYNFIVFFYILTVLKIDRHAEIKKGRLRLTPLGLTNSGSFRTPLTPLHGAGSSFQWTTTSGGIIPGKF